MYKQFTAKEGLPSNTIYDINQDEKGYMWFATDNGLCRFDGSEFITYSLGDGLPDNEILKLYRDAQDRIWLMGFNGEVGFLKNGIFYNRDNTPLLKKLSFKNNIDVVFEDTRGVLWFFGRNVRLRCITPAGQILEAPESESKFFPMTFVENDKSDVFLVSNKNPEEVYHLNTTENAISVEEVPYQSFIKTVSDKESFERLRRLGLFAESDTIGTVLLKYAKERITGFNSFWPPKFFFHTRNRFWLISNFMGLHLLSNEQGKLNIDLAKKDFAASSYYKDLEGNEWISSVNQGVLLFPKTNIDIVNPEEDLYAIHRINDSLIYTGSYQGNLLEFSGKGKMRNVFNNNGSRFSKTSPNKIVDITKYEDHLVLICNHDVRIFENRKGAFTGRFAVLSLGSGKHGFVDKGILHLAASNSVYRINLERFLKVANWSTQSSIDFSQNNDVEIVNQYIDVVWKNRGSAILKDRNGRLWIGTNKGLFYEKEGQVFPYRDDGEFSRCNITHIKETGNGTLVVATNGFGLGVIEKDSSYFISHIDQEINPVINRIRTDKDESLWLATNKGIFNGTVTDFKFHTKKKYTLLEGLSSKNIRDLKIQDSVIYATSPKGLNIIKPEAGNTKKKQPVPIYITRVTVNEVPQNPESISELSHSQNDLYFDFSGLSFRSLGQVRYQYRLTPWEKQWISTTSRGVRYSNLPGNAYTFEVKAIDKDGNESAVPAVLNFTINQAWYATKWFLISLLLLGLLLTWILVSTRMETIRKRGEYNEKIAILKHQALLTQMNPHFIYNTLSSVQHFVLKNDIDSAQRQLAKFGELIRTILTNSKKTAIPLTEEVKLLENYLELEKVRYHDSFDYTVKVEVVDVEDVEMPPMVMQPIVENAIIHGITPLKDKRGKITITFKESGNKLICMVLDNGIGMEASGKLKKESIIEINAIALNNIRERLNLFGKGNYPNALKIETLFDTHKKVTGTLVTVTIPIQNYD